MKADSSAQRHLLQVQDLDTALLQLKHKAASLPIHATIAAARRDAGSLEERYVAADTRASDAERDLRQSEADLEPVKQRRQRDQQRIDAGSIIDAKALQSLIDEVAHLDKRISDLEDVELEAMELAEATAAERDHLKAELDGSANKLADLVAARDAEVGELQTQARQLQQRRGPIVAQVPAELMELYTRIAAKSGGMGAARLQNGRRCSGCGIEANTADVVRYQAAAPEDVLRCEECGRILVRGADE